MTEKPKATSQSPEQPQTLVTPIASLAEQVGQHVLSALSQDETVAVLTTITGSRHGKQVISMPLNAHTLHEVQSLLHAVEENDEPERMACIGFHCAWDDDDGSEGEQAAETS
ncbi:MAG: hypothetical protein VX589_08130 [Myxococcota bacterium]|nr:hypothetical protein [Myxococcota bacterium]